MIEAETKALGLTGVINMTVMIPETREIVVKGNTLKPKSLICTVQFVKLMTTLLSCAKVERWNLSLTS